MVTHHELRVERTAGRLGVELDAPDALARLGGRHDAFDRGVVGVDCASCIEVSFGSKKKRRPAREVRGRPGDRSKGGDSLKNGCQPLGNGSTSSSAYWSAMPGEWSVLCREVGAEHARARGRGCDSRFCEVT